MKKIFLPLLFALTACSDQSPGLASYWLSWSDDMLTQWQVKSTVLNSNASAYCAGNIELDQLKNNWEDLALHWAALNNFPYQAITDNNLEFDLYFWPDKRNMIEQRLSQRIQNQQPLVHDDMTNTVAAEKGLPAMEWLIYNENLNSEERCLAQETIASYYSQQVDGIVQYHQDYPIVQAQWAEERISIEGASISLNLSFQQTAHIGNQLRNGLDDSGQPIAILSEGWRSSLTKDIYLTSFASLTRHMEAALIRLELSSNSYDLLATQVSRMQELEASLFAAPEVVPTIMLEIQIALVDLEQLIEGPLAADTGVLIGFNNYDGD